MNIKKIEFILLSNFQCESSPKTAVHNLEGMMQRTWWKS